MEYISEIKKANEVGYEAIIPNLINYIKSVWNIELTYKNQSEFNLPKNNLDLQAFYEKDTVDYILSENYKDLLEIFIAPIWQYGFDCGVRNLELRELEKLQKRNEHLEDKILEILLNNVITNNKPT